MNRFQLVKYLIEDVSSILIENKAFGYSTAWILTCLHEWSSKKFSTLHTY